MKIICVAMSIALAFATPARAGDAAQDAADRDETLITDCAALPSAAAIDFYTRSQTAQFCQMIAGVLEGVRIMDLRYFEKGALVLSHSDCKGDSETADKAIKQLVEIIRLRGQYKSRAKWEGTLDLVARACQAFKGVVTPSVIIALLRSAGPAAKTASDDALLMMLIMVKQRYQRGD
jgi:hypothetical protein